jgi:hypothetical protein
MCGEREGVRVNRTEVTMYDGASKAFPNNSSFNYFNVCINNPDQKARKVWILSKIPNRFAPLEISSGKEDINLDWENIKGNTKISAKGILNLHELKQCKTWFDEE